MAVDSGRVEAAVTELLLAIGEDPNRPALVETPRRVAESYAEFFAGVGEDAVGPLRHSATIDLAPARAGEVVIVRDISFRSICEHHLLPFVGVAHVAYLPKRRVVGLGALARAVETLSARPQLQERLTEDIADALESGLDPAGVLVVMDARHGCVVARGARQSTSTTVTLAARGELRDPVRRAETMAMISSSTTG